MGVGENVQKQLLGERRKKHCVGAVRQTDAIQKLVEKGVLRNDGIKKMRDEHWSLQQPTAI